jgi:hypothetical protein
MVKFVSKGGVVHHEPPYTEAEGDELYRRMDAGPFARIVRPSSTPQPPPRKSPPPPRKE